jgi:integrase/recombinase XerD
VTKGSDRPVAVAAPARGISIGGVVAVGGAVNEYLQYLVVERGLAANTIESYRRDLRRYAEVLAARGKTRLDDVGTADVSAFLGALRTGDEDHPPLAVSSAGRAVVAVRGLHSFALAQGMCADDPAREVAPPAPPKRLPKAISIAEVERLLEAAGSTQDPEPRVLRDRALLEFLYGTGARISEAVGLDIRDLDLSADPSVLLSGKGGKSGSYLSAATRSVRSRHTSSAAARRLRPAPAARSTPCS